MRPVVLHLFIGVVAAAILGCQAASDRTTGNVDVSSPEATVIGFTKAAARGEKDAAQAYFLPGGTDYEDVKEILNATPSSPVYEMRKMLESLDADIPMPIVSKEETPYGVKVIWRVTFKREFKVSEELIFNPGMTYDFDATLKKSGDQWLIDNF